jgi:predicted metal-dependent hydrolase
MAKNENGYIAVDAAKVKRTKQEQMDRFDSFSPEIRAALRDAPYNVSIKDGHERVFRNGMWLKETLKRIAKESALKTYGPNYPLETVK